MTLAASAPGLTMARAGGPSRLQAGPFFGEGAMPLQFSFKVLRDPPSFVAKQFELLAKFLDVEGLGKQGDEGIGLGEIQGRLVGSACG